MKIIGLILLFGGILFGLYALSIDTSVKVNYDGINNSGGPDRVNNLGLMSEKQNYLIFSGVLAIIGAILYFSGIVEANAGKKSNSYFGDSKPEQQINSKQIKLQQQYDKGEITFDVYQSEWNKLNT